MKLHDENKKLAKLLHFGGSEGFKVIFHRFYAPLCSFASRYLEGEEVEDVVQETMMWLWEHRDSLLPDVNVTSLLFTMVRNKCLNHVRHLTRRQRVHEKLGARYQAMFEEPRTYLDQELFNHYRQALSSLPPHFREAFEMSREGGMTHEEIARKLGVSRQTVNYRLGKALTYLKEAMKEFVE